MVEKLIDFLRTCLDRTPLWFWLSCLTTILVTVNQFQVEPNETISKHGLIAASIFTALFLQSKTIHSIICTIIKEKYKTVMQWRIRRRKLKYLLITPCKEHVLLVAYADLFSALSKKNVVPSDQLYPLFFRDDKTATALCNSLVQQGLAQIDTTSGSPLVHDWVRLAFQSQLNSKSDNACRNTLSLLKKYGVQLYNVSLESALFTHTEHSEIMRSLTSDA